MAENSIGQLKSGDRNKILEVLYRRWIARNVPMPTPIGYCGIWLDGEGNAIQANMNVSDIEYFSQNLEVAKQQVRGNMLLKTKQV
ncbi:hypothetical protein Tco_0123875 [Tanacetum coccineum]